VREVASTRTVAGVSQRQVAAELRWSQSAVTRLERAVDPDRISLVDLARVASVLGLELSAQFHLAGEPIRDAGQQALAGRLRSILAPAWKVMAEVLLPNPGDRRSWDLLLRLEAQRVGAELETRVRDVQRLVRHTRERERDGGVDHVLLVLSASAHNRRMLPKLLEALGREFATRPRLILRALREGRPVPGSGVILL
jgi:transcriptional regulator with XRE-family HTH domain